MSHDHEPSPSPEIPAPTVIRRFETIPDYTRQLAIRHLLVSLLLILPLEIFLMLLPGPSQNEDLLVAALLILIPSFLIWVARVVLSRLVLIEVRSDGILIDRLMSQLISLQDITRIDIRRVVGAYILELDRADDTRARVKLRQSMIGPAADVLDAVRSVAVDAELGPGAEAILDGRSREIPRCVAPFDAAALSTLLPGLGQIYNGHWAEGVPLTIVGPMAVAYLSLHALYLTPSLLAIGIIVVILWVAAAGDAGLTAERRYRLYQTHRRIPRAVAEDIHATWLTVPALIVIIFGAVYTYGGALLAFTILTTESQDAAIVGFTGSILLYIWTIAWIGAGIAQIIVDLVMQFIGVAEVRAMRTRRLFWGMIGIMILLLLLVTAPGPKRLIGRMPALMRAIAVGGPDATLKTAMTRIVMNPKAWPPRAESAAPYFSLLHGMSRDQSLTFSERVDFLIAARMRFLGGAKPVGAEFALNDLNNPHDVYWDLLGMAIVPKLSQPSPEEAKRLLWLVSPPRAQSTTSAQSELPDIIGSLNRSDELNTDRKTQDLLWTRWLLTDLMAASGPDHRGLNALATFVDSSVAMANESSRSSWPGAEMNRSQVFLASALVHLALGEREAAAARARLCDSSGREIYLTALDLREGRDTRALARLKWSPHASAIRRSLRCWAPAGAIAPATRTDLELLLARADNFIDGVWFAPALPTGSARPPQASGEGIVFEFQAAETSVVFLAGTFNDWAENRNSEVTDRRFAMQHVGKGLFRTVVPLEPGRHEFKYVIDGRNWRTDPVITEYAGPHSNSVIHVMTDGSVRYRHNRAPASALAGL